MLRHRIGKVALFVFAAIGVAYGGLMLFLKFVASPPACLWTTAAVVASPSAHYFAKVQTKSCTLEPVQTLVSLHKDREERVGSTSYRVFEVASSVHNANGGYSIVPISLSWLSDNEIQIVHPKGIGITSGDHMVDGIKVTYRESEPIRP